MNIWNKKYNLQFNFFIIYNLRNDTIIFRINQLTYENQH